jgi:glycosyltransferase involved in cell wall biosynthesis
MTAYGIQTRLLAQSLPRYGYTVAIAANFGIHGAVVNSTPKIYPASVTQSGDANVWAAAEDFKPDAIISLYDVWALKFPNDPALEHIPWIAWATVDSGPIDLRTPYGKMLSEKAAGVVAYSQFGRKVMEQAGLTPHYIPLGIQTDLFVPGDKAAARDGLTRPGTDEPLGDAFLFGMVGRNNTAPSRKGFDIALLAFARFHARHPDAFLYLHTFAGKQDGGLDLYRMMAELGITNAVLLCNQAQERLGYSDNTMVRIFQSLDTLLMPSRAEGFGVPVIEAAAAGTPAIATNHSSMTELVKESGGWLVKSQPMRIISEAWWANPDINHMVHAMEQAYASKNSGEIVRRGQTARRFAEKYDFEGVVAPSWDQFLRTGDWQR